MQDQVIITIENLWKSFGGKVVLKNINTKIKEGKITVIMGRSGCGKTVLMKHIVGILSPDRGRIFFENEDITKISKDEKLRYIRNFGFLFQNSALFDWMTVEENVAFPLYEIKRIRNIQEIKQRVSEILEVVGLKGHEKKYPSELSGGMQKRTALARAIIHEPKVVVLDEPTSGIDPATTSVIEDLILDIKKRIKSTFIVITHDIKSALRLADHIIFMKDGEIIWEGEPQELKQKESTHSEIDIFLKRLEF
ncbi:MAG: ATP-binding cassette domain-containing protein [Candidatus Calescibacterium sp.]|nr:ATP-binding cassette domain-containing protein [Candidatus Calescibacterium sp.]MCX7733470.1 ATP-binding cassette domain-containing protein [bacterium]MDW8087451.1 ATP-binding cassette domain-containing protein [Candidatus Calescibacterium sp.]